MKGLGGKGSTYLLWMYLVIKESSFHVRFHSVVEPEKDGMASLSKQLLTAGINKACQALQQDGGGTPSWKQSRWASEREMVVVCSVLLE